MRFYKLKNYIYCISLLLLTFSALSAEKWLPIKGTVFEVEKHTAFLIMPEKVDETKPIPWLWYAPTLKGLPSKMEKHLFEQLLKEGIAIAGIDVGESMGNSKGRALFSALYKELTENRGLSKKASLIARSRGGLMQYNWAVENPEKVACIAGIYPVCNLASWPGLKKASRAYETNAEGLKKILPANNPIERLAPLAKAKVPLFHIHGDSDKVVPHEKNTAILAQRYKALGGSITVEVPKGQGHNYWKGFFESETMLKFIIKHSK